MKNYYLWTFLMICFLSGITTAKADSAVIEMVYLTLIDSKTGKEIKTTEGYNGVRGELDIRCYGYNWKELGYGEGFDDSPPPNYVPEEVYTVHDYYKGSYKLTDMTSYIRFKTFEYCDLELVTDEGVKYLAAKYNKNYEFPTMIVDRADCKFSEDIIQGEVCNMEITVTEVDFLPSDSMIEEDYVSEENLDNTLMEDDSDYSYDPDDSEFIDSSPDMPSDKPVKKTFWGYIWCAITSLWGGRC